MPFTIFRENFVLSKGKIGNKKNKFKRWFVEWNKVIGSCFAFLTFFLLLVLVIYNTTSKSDSKECTDCKNICTLLPDVKSGHGKCSRIGNIVNCTDINEKETNLTEEINKVLHDSSRRAIRLSLKNVNFNETILEIGWLKFLELPVSELIFSRTNIEEIGKGAFEGYPFGSLVNLTLSKTEIRTLRKEAFQNSLIEFLKIQCQIQGQVLTVEAEALAGVAKTLTTLQINRCLKYPETVQNLTGKTGSVLTNLEVVDFGFNMLSDLNEGSFDGANNIKFLYLDHNSLKKIHAKTFWPLKKCQTLTLNNNLLPTLPKTIFDSIVASKGQIFLHGNFWQCHCEMEWLKILHTQNNVVNKTEPLICENYGDLFENVDFCQNEISTEISTEIVGVTEKSVFTDSIFLEDEVIKFDVYEYDSVLSKIRINLAKPVPDMCLYWFNIDKPDELGIKNDLKHFDELKLDFSTSYIFYILIDDQPLRSPFDVLTLTTSPKPSDLAWVRRSEVPVFIGTICGILLALILLSVLVMYYCIFCNPKLIKGSKRVIVVDSKTTDAIILPKELDKQCVNPSLISLSHGYVTPKFQNYSRVANNCLVGNVPESNSSGIYFNPDDQQPNISVRHKNFKQHRSTLCDLVEDYEHIYEKPPLPPNHPCEKRRASERIDCLYNVV